MPYRYEDLDEKRFQKLCQSLLIESFPTLHCLPVSQPDGGRDAVDRKPGKPADHWVVATSLISLSCRASLAVRATSATRARFLCQAHRAVLLDKADFLKQLPVQIGASTARVVFRVDLRDYARWLEGYDPFVEDDTDHAHRQREREPSRQEPRSCSSLRIRLARSCWAHRARASPR